MKNRNLFKIFIVVSFVIFSGVFLVSLTKSEIRIENQMDLDEIITANLNDLKNYRKWTKVNDKPKIMWSGLLALCRAPFQKEMDDNIHNDRYVNVYVNSIGKLEMLSKKNPKFPVGTIIVKEKLNALDSKVPSLLTIMIKQKKGFNPDVGDWEFMTTNGDTTEITSKGKLESCQSCHITYKENDYISRDYLPNTIKQKLK